MVTRRYSAGRIERLRKKVAAVFPENFNPPTGWSKSAVDPMNVLAVFKSLRVRSGLVLRAYQYYDGANGNAIVWALPKDAPFPEPDQCSKVDNHWLSPPKPPAVMDDLMGAITGTGTPWAYLSASIFKREIQEFGARWHGCNWSTHQILDADPRRNRRQLRYAPGDDSPTVGADWIWLEASPSNWMPRVVVGEGTVNVIFFTYSLLGLERIYGHTDTFRMDGFSFKTECRPIAEGHAGIVL